MKGHLASWVCYREMTACEYNIKKYKSDIKSNVLICNKMLAADADC